jgi:hypothetical protein
VSAAFAGPCIADRGPKSIRVYTTEKRPRLVAVIRLADHGSVDELLRVYGWRVVGAWFTSDDMPDDHTCAAIERSHA